MRWSQTFVDLLLLLFLNQLSAICNKETYKEKRSKCVIKKDKKKEEEKKKKKKNEKKDEKKDVVFSTNPFLWKLD